MAKIRTMANAKRVGRVGDSTYYVRNGEQIVRQSMNNSNFGSSARRSEAQQARRARWGNLVNFYKACAYWMPKAYENKASNQTDYNRFMQLNVNRSTVYLSKDMVAAGCAVAEDFQISGGSLPPIALASADGNSDYPTGIALGAALSSLTTVGAFASAIVNNNDDFKAGDNLAMIVFKQTENNQGEFETVHLNTDYYEITLATDNTAALSSNPMGAFLGSLADNTLSLLRSKIFTPSIAGVVLIHTRLDGILKVSTQNILITNESFRGSWNSPAWAQEAIATYGLDGDVPLDPSFNHAVIRQVTANGSTITTGDNFTESFGMRIEGRGLAGGQVRVTKNGVYFPALSTSDDALIYLVDSNGDYVVEANGEDALSFTVSDLAKPTNVTGTTRFWQKANTQLTETGRANQRDFTGYWAHYAFKSSSTYPYFLVRVDIPSEGSISVNDFTFDNCSVNLQSVTAGQFILMNVRVLDANKPAYVSTQGVIIAVFNYIG